jgi:hypothetical protein
MKKINKNYFMLSALSILAVSAVAYAETTIENMELNIAFQENSTKSPTSPAQRNFDIRTSSVRMGFFTIPPVTLPVNANGNRCSAMEMKEVSLKSNQLSFLLSLHAECSNINTTLSGNLAETVCATALSNFPITVDFGPLFKVQVKRGSKQDLIVKLNEETLDIAIEQVSTVLTAMLPDSPQGQIQGLNFNTPFANAFSQETKDEFNRNMGCMAWDKNVMIGEAATIARTILSNTFTISAGQVDVSHLSLENFTPGEFLHTGLADVNQWDLVILD